MNSKNQKSSIGVRSFGINSRRGEDSESPRIIEDNLPSKTSSEVVLDGFAVRLRSWEPNIRDEALEALRLYLSELLRFNKSLNLISASTVGRADVVHILDAARAWSLVGPCIPANSLVYDFGSGNGLPGIVAAILAPGVIFRLVDRDQRKVEFLKHVVAALALNNVSVIREDLREIRDRSVKFGISRGLASVANSLLQGRRMFESGGQFFMLKGEGWARELAEVQPQIFSDWSVEMMGQYRLPDSAADFVVLRGTRLN